MKSPARLGLAAFTLIELMAVITIIVILAALVVGAMGFVNERQAKEKARVQIAMISKALEEYKRDNGAYPATPNLTAFGPNKDQNTRFLFDALYFQGAQDTTGETTIYIGELNPANSKQGWTSGTASSTTKIIDPWGTEYCYRSALNAAGGPNNNTQNPDFDLWSVGKDGKTAPGTPNDPRNRDDIKNF